MDKYTYLILDALFFIPFILLWILLFRKIILTGLKFIFISGLLGGIVFFVIDLPATLWGAWTTNYEKTLGPMFATSVIEELIWAILVFMSVAIMIEVLLERLHYSPHIKNTERAFLWIIDILEKNAITYKISGGFAAKIYGTDRELADIDIEVQDEDIIFIEKEVRPYITFGPDRYKDERWDLELMTLLYEGQEIDIAGTNAKIFNKEKQEWDNSSGDFENIEIKEVYSKNVPVESLKSLIEYKKKLGREVDTEDVRQLELIYKNFNS